MSEEAAAPANVETIDPDVAWLDATFQDSRNGLRAAEASPKASSSGIRGLDQAPWHAIAAKRSVDVAFSLAALILTLPVWLLVILAVLFEDGLPIFYRQTRWGKGGSEFAVLKFRTMNHGCDQSRRASPDDERVTRIGRLLRATGIDELPQFLNILRGQMSLVGPRPLSVTEEVEDEDGFSLPYEAIPEFDTRLTVRPGLTSPATIYLPKDVNPTDKVNQDIAYIRGWSFLGDLKLIVLSVWISLRGCWERRSPKL